MCRPTCTTLQPFSERSYYVYLDINQTFLIQQGPQFHSMMFQCWASVKDCGPSCTQQGPQFDSTAPPHYETCGLRVCHSIPVHSTDCTDFFTFLNSKDILFIRSVLRIF